MYNLNDTIFILDLIGVAIGGLELPFPQMMTQYLASLGGKPEATLLGSINKEKVPAVHSALGNGVCGHALDMDDGYRYGGVHPSVGTVPAAIAAGEITDSGGKALILGTVLGVEIINRLAKAMNPSHLSRGFHTTGTLGPFGAAVAAGKIYGLSEEKLTRALGLAGLQSAGLLEILHDGAMTKPILPGKAAMAAIFGDAGMDRFSAETVNDREIQNLAGRVTATSDEKWANAYPDMRGASVEMTTQDGKRYFMEVELAKGEPENPATLEDLVGKFRNNVSKMPSGMCERLITVIMDLENHTVSDLTQYFCF